MAEIIDARAERFTLYLNADRKPVQRTLREMTVGEVIAAIEWSAIETERLEREAVPASALIAAIEEGCEKEIATADIKAAAAAVRAAGNAMNRHATLLSLVHAAMPQWRGQKTLGLYQAIRRYWPGGRHNVVDVPDSAA
jgi:hypothetical protein